MTSYINSLEADRAKLKAQVRRLCEENSWLQQELTRHQQLLTETEAELVKAREEREQLEFLVTIPPTATSAMKTHDSRTGSAAVESGSSHNGTLHCNTVYTHHYREG